VKHIRNLGLAIALTLALAAFGGVATASAAWLVPSTTGNTFLKATPTNTHVIGTGAGPMACHGPVVAGWTEGPTKTFGTSTSSFSCFMGGGEQTMKTNGCRFIFDVNGTFEIGPAGCGPMTMKYMLGACTLSIHPTAGLNAKYENVGSGSSAGVSVTSYGHPKLKYSDSCNYFGSGEDGTYAGAWEVRGFMNATHTIPTGISISPTAPVGFFRANGEFNSESYPVTVSGSKPTQVLLLFPPQVGSCQAQPIGTLTGPETQLDLSLPLSSCVLAGLSANAKMNGCGIRFDAASGNTDIVCSGENAIELESTVFGAPMCKVSIPAQTIDNATYGSTGSSFQRRVTAFVEGTSMDYVVTYSANSVVCPETGSNGTFRGQFDLGASK
jgi:hypothetical protein